jgi:hypothetical protein
MEGQVGAGEGLDETEEEVGGTKEGALMHERGRTLATHAPAPMHWRNWPLCLRAGTAGWQGGIKKWRAANRSLDDENNASLQTA